MVKHKVMIGFEKSEDSEVSAILEFLSCNTLPQNSAGNL